MTGVRRNFDVIVTRDTKESCAMVVEATSREEAEAHALQRAVADADLVWEYDDAAGAGRSPYVSSCEETQ